MRKPISTLSGQEYPFERMAEFTENGDPLVFAKVIIQAYIRLALKEQIE